MNKCILNSRTPGTNSWRLHSYARRSGNIICLVISPDGTRINESLMDFVQQAGGREWDNDPEDIQAMLDLALMEEVRHA